VKGRRNREGQDVPRTTLLAPFTGARHRRGAAGDHNLTGRVEVDRRHRAAARCFFVAARSFDLVIVEADHRRHRPITDRYRLLHQPAP
jgi:hypothetical protein